MSYSNQYHYKARVAPQDYLNGPCKVYTKEEIEEWERNIDPKLTAKLKAQEGMSEEDIKFLDSLIHIQVEEEFIELLEGTIEAPTHDFT